MKNSYTVKENGFQAYWFEGTTNREKVIIWMHGSGMNENHCLKDSEYLREKGYSVLVLGFYFWKGMSKKMRGIPVDYIEKAVSELKKNGFEKIGIHGISSGAAYALLCASLIPDISLVLSICPFDYVVEEPKIFGKPTGRSWFSYHGKDYPCSLFTGQREKGFFGSLREYRKQDTEHHNEFLRSLYENAALTMDDNTLFCIVRCIGISCRTSWFCKSLLLDLCWNCCCILRCRSAYNVYREN